MTLGNYLNGMYSKTTNLSVLVGNYNLREVDMSAFEKRFGKMTKEELVGFILDPANSYELSKFGYDSEEYILADDLFVTVNGTSVRKSQYGSLPISFEDEESEDF